MKSLINLIKTFSHLCFLILIISSKIESEEDLINLSNYTYPSPSDSSFVYIPILATNDLHGGIFPSKFADSNKKRYSNGGANYLYSYKKILKEEWGDRLIWLDGGDQFQGTIECMLSDCLIMKDFYNQAGIDAIALGNHDFDYGIDYLKEYVKKMNFPLVVANVKEVSSGKYLYETWDNVKAYQIYEYKVNITGKEGVIKIGVIGLATTQTKTMTATNVSSLDITDYVEETKKWRDYLVNTENCTAVLVLPHFGPMCSNDGAAKYELKMREKKDNQKMCDETQEIMDYLKQLKAKNIDIDGVVAAHVHDIVHHWISDVPVVESSGADYFNILYLPFRYYKKSYTLAKDKIKIEGPVPVCEKIWPDSKNCEYKYQDSSVMKKFTFHGKEVTLDPEMKTLLQYWEKFIDEKINNDLVETDDEITKKDNIESSLANFVNDVGRIVTDSDICFYNSGGIRADWHKGPINELDLFKVFPFNNTWVRFEMTGEEVLHMFQILDRWYFYPSTGLIHNYRYRNKEYEIKSLIVYDGFVETPLDLKKTYKICTNDFLANGGSQMKNVRTWYKELRNKKDFGIIRDLIKGFLQKMKGHIREDKFIDKNYPKYIIEQ